ncbi:MAG: hypothetical protein AAGK97_01830, partial [Bacteroidota bacterium]
MLLSSCYMPKAVLKLEPDNNQPNYWELGDQVVSYKKDSIQLDIAYHRSTDKYIIFKSRIFNHSSAQIHVDPKKAYLNIETTEGLDARLNAINPEQKVLQQQLAVAQQEANVKSAKFWNVVDVAASIVAGGDTLDSDAEVYDSQNKLVYLRDELINWSGDLLRKSDLFKNYYVDGFLFFPRSEKA